jgi:hypothetical protein
LQIRIRILRASAYGYLRPPLHPLAASPRSRLSSPSSTASPHAWACCSGRCRSNLRIRVKNCRILLGPPRSSGLGGRRPSSRYLAMPSPILYCLGGSRIRVFTADPGVFSSAVPTVPVESGTLHTATSTDLATLLQPRRPPQPWPLTTASSPHPSLLGFYTRRGLGGLPAPEFSVSILHQVNFHSGWVKFFDLSICSASALTSQGQYIIGPRWHQVPRLFSTSSD